MYNELIKKLQQYNQDILLEDRIQGTHCVIFPRNEKVSC